MIREIRFDDVDQLRAAVSDEYGEWGPELEISQALIDDFADLTGDHQWIHVDVERAKAGPFGAPIAHGLLILALGPSIRSRQSYTVVGHGSVLNYGSDGVRFLEPVPAGSLVHSRSRLVDVQEHARGTRMTSEIAVHVVGNERPSMVFKAVTMNTP